MTAVPAGIENQNRAKASRSPDLKARIREYGLAGLALNDSLTADSDRPRGGNSMTTVTKAIRKEIRLKMVIA
jgi:hypothetical protein